MSGPAAAEREAVVETGTPGGEVAGPISATDEVLVLDFVASTRS